MPHTYSTSGIPYKAVTLFILDWLLFAQMYLEQKDGFGETELKYKDFLGNQGIHNIWQY